MVFLEVMLAGRTEPELVAALHPLIARQNEDLCAAARKNPVFARLSDESQQVMKDIAQTRWHSRSSGAQHSPNLTSTRSSSRR